MLRVTVWRTVPLVASSTFPNESAFNETWRRTSFSSSTCVRALSRGVALGVELDRLLAEVDRGTGVLEIEARTDLTPRLVDRVADLLHVELGDHVERRHRSRSSYSPRSTRGERRADVVRTRRRDRPDTVRRPGSVPEWPKGAVCKTAGRPTLVRIQPGPLARFGGPRSFPLCCDPRSDYRLAAIYSILVPMTGALAEGPLGGAAAARRGAAGARRLRRQRVPLRQELRGQDLLQGARELAPLRRGVGPRRARGRPVEGRDRGSAATPRGRRSSTPIPTRR